MTMKLFAATAVSLMLTTTFATAGGHDSLGSSSVVFASPAAPATTTALNAPWTGFYLGGSIGSVTDGNLAANDLGPDQSFEVDGHSPIGGFIGYQYQSGQFVFGGEYAISFADDVAIDSAPNDFAAGYGDLKARVGYALP